MCVSNYVVTYLVGVFILTVRMLVEEAHARTHKETPSSIITIIAAFISTRHPCSPAHHLHPHTDQKANQQNILKSKRISKTVNEPPMLAT